MAGGARAYGYRFRDDTKPPLGVQPDPLQKKADPAAVADAAAAAGLVATPSTASITQLGTGLIFRDRFDRADGALGADWTTVNGTWAIAGNVARGSPAASTAENVVASVLAAPAAGTFERVVQANVKVSAATVTAALRARWDGGTEAAGNGYLLELVAGVGFNLTKQIAGAYTVLVAIANAALAANVLAGLKLHVKNGSQKAYADGRLLAAAADAALDAATGKAGHRAKNTSAGAGPTTTTDDFAVYSSNVVTVSGLPAGYQVRVNGTLFASAAGVASCDLAGAMCPLQTIEVLDANRNVLATLVPDGGLWGGDTYLFTAIGAASGITAVPLSGTTIRVQWNALEGADAYRVEWHSGDGVWTAFADVPADRLILDHAGLTERTTRYYRVSGVKAGGAGVPTATTSATTTLLAPPTCRLVNSGGGAAQGTVNWDATSAKATGYQLQRATDVGGAFADLVLLGPAATQYIDNAVVEGTRYRYRVAPVDVIGDRAYSDEGSIVAARDPFALAQRPNLVAYLVPSASDTAKVPDLSGQAHHAVYNKVVAAGIIKNNPPEVDYHNNGLVMLAKTPILGGNLPQTLTLHFWIRTAPGGSTYATAFSTSADGDFHLYTKLSTTEQLGYFVDTVSADRFFNGPAMAPALDSWHDVCFVIDGVSGNAKFYVDGVLGLSANRQIRSIASAILQLGYFSYAFGVGPKIGVALVYYGVALTAAEILQNRSAIPALYGYPLNGAPDIRPATPTTQVPVGIGPPGTYDGVAVGISNYYTGILGYSGQTVIVSHPATGAWLGTPYSVPQDITFSADVAEVRVEIGEVDNVGGTVQAFDVGGALLGTVAIPNYAATIARDAGSAAVLTYPGIRRVRVTPPANDVIVIRDIKFKH